MTITVICFSNNNIINVIAQAIYVKTKFTFCKNEDSLLDIINIIIFYFHT